MESDIEMKDSTLFMNDDEESVQRPEKKQSRHDEEIHRSDSMPMSLNKSEPIAFLSARRMISREVS